MRHDRAPHFSASLQAVLLAVIWLLGWQPLRATEQAPDQDALKERIATCIGCHGEHGEGGDNAFNPRLAGKPAGYLARQIRYFHDGLRRYPMMEYTVRGLDPAYVQEIADYFAAQNVPYAAHPAPGVSAEFVARGEQLALHGDDSRHIPACARCHGERLSGVEPDVPGLIGLPYDYLSAQFGAWRTHTRAMAAPDCMAQISGRLSDSDISAVSAYLATRPIPADPHPQAAGSTQMPLRCGDVKG